MSEFVATTINIDDVKEFLEKSGGLQAGEDVKERKKELEVMTFLLRPRHVLYTHPRKVKFNDEDLNKIFKPMEVKANVENDELR